MIFSELIREIELYLHIQGSETRYLIKDFINESILDFIRIEEWKYSRFSNDIVLDGSEQYDLTTILTNPFYGEIDLIKENSYSYRKFNYETYIKSQSKIGSYSILGNTLYVEGEDTTLRFVYVTPGLPYPLVNDNDENLVTRYYWDIIKKMAVIKMLHYLGDDVVVREEELLKEKLFSLKFQENRIEKKGKFKMVVR